MPDINNNPQTFQVLIELIGDPQARGVHRQSVIYFQYKDITTDVPTTVGIEDQRGCKGVSYDYRLLEDQKALLIRQWSSTYYVRSLTIDVSKSDSYSYSRFIDDSLWTRGTNVILEEDVPDPEMRYVTALGGTATFLLSVYSILHTPPALVTGVGLLLDGILLYVELAEWVAENQRKAKLMEKSPDLRWVKAKAVDSAPYPATVFDAMFNMRAFWFFNDTETDDKNHWLEVRATLTYFECDSLGTIIGEYNVSTSVTLNVLRDTGNSLNDPNNRILEPGRYIAFLSKSGSEGDRADTDDYYKFFVSQNMVIQLTMIPPRGTNVNFDLYLYNPNGEEVESSCNGDNETETIYYVTEEGGYYHIRVKAEDGYGFYTLIVHEPYPAPPPGGCPYVYAWNGSAYMVDNNVLALSEISNGSDVEDFYRIEQAMLPHYAGHYFSGYSLMLGEFENEHSYIDKVRLIAVDHDSNVNIALTPDGQILTYTDPSPPVSAIDNYGQDWLPWLLEPDNHYYRGVIDDWLLIDFGSLDISQAAKLVLRANLEWKKDTCIHVQVLNETSGWMDAAILRTRYHWSTLIVDLSDYLPSPDGTLKIRLYFTGIHKIDYVGLDTSPQQNIEVHTAPPVLALHSENGIVTWKLLLNDQIYAELLPGQQIYLYFILPNTDKARTFIIYLEGHYYTIQ